MTCLTLPCWFVCEGEGPQDIRNFFKTPAGGTKPAPKPAAPAKTEASPSKAKPAKAVASPKKAKTAEAAPERRSPERAVRNSCRTARPQPFRL